jgi:hypothetical protein
MGVAKCLWQDDFGVESDLAGPIAPLHTSLFFILSIERAGGTAY